MVGYQVRFHGASTVASTVNQEGSNSWHHQGPLAQESDLDSPILAHLHAAELITPAFVYDETTLLQRCEDLRAVADEAGCRLLFSLKPLTLTGALRLIAGEVDGFSASSAFEARLARANLGASGTVHFTSPGLRPDEIGELAELCDFISFNSLSQWERFHRALPSDMKRGLRFNPQRSFICDQRYDPCRSHSKLGVTLEGLVATFGQVPSCIDGVDGLHVHLNCDSHDFSQFLTSVYDLETQLGPLLHNMDWINLGGGYLFDEESSDLVCFNQGVELLRCKYGLEVFVEPGATAVREAGYIVSSVIDLFCSDGVDIAVLDTTVNHMPEVFEYQFAPDVWGHQENAGHKYLLAGSSCLSGDMFGEYCFSEPLKIGSRVIFSDAGAYTLVKAHTFNGINLPSIYAITCQDELVLKKRFTFTDFASRWSA